MSELQKRYTERARLKVEEKKLNQMIEKTKSQLIQLQVEASDIKSRIVSTSQTRDDVAMKPTKSTVADVEEALREQGNEYDEDDKELELDLSTNNDVLEKMLRGQFSTNDMEEGDKHEWLANPTKHKKLWYKNEMTYSLMWCYWGKLFIMFNKIFKSIISL